jgi:phenolic acid decarboxylase
LDIGATLPPSKQILPEQRTYAQDVACYDAEGNDNKRNEDRQSEVYGKVVLVQFEECTYGREVGQEQEVKQVDVQCASAYALQAASYKGHF